MAASAAGEPPAPRANRSPAVVPQGVYPSEGEDAWVALTVQSDAAWGRCVELLARPALADPALRLLPERRRRHDAIDEQIAAWTSARSAHEAVALLQEAGIAAGPVLSNLELVADEHLRARAMLVTIEHPDAGAREFPGFPIHLSETPVTRFAGAPTVGGDNEAILRDLLGYNAEEYGALRAAGVVADTPEGEASG